MTKVLVEDGSEHMYYETKDALYCQRKFYENLHSEPNKMDDNPFKV